MPASTRRWKKIEMESSSGTLTDMTPFIKSIEIKPYKPSLWKLFCNWLFWRYFQFKLRKSWKKLSNTKLTIEFEQKPPRDSWRWN